MANDDNSGFMAPRIEARIPPQQAEKLKLKQSSSIPPSIPPSKPPVQPPASPPFKPPARPPIKPYLKSIIKPDSTNQVVVVDIQIPFWSMVVLMVKMSFAAIPAFFIIAVVWMIIAGLLGSFVMSIFPR